MKKRGQILSWVTLACFIAGAAAGLVWPEVALSLGQVGSLYVSLLKYLALPVVILSVFNAVQNGGKSATGVLVRALLLFIGLFAVSFLICAVPYTVFAPGKGFSALGGASWTGEQAAISLKGILRNLVSFGGGGNVNNYYLPSLGLALVFGFIASLIKSERLKRGAASLEKALLTLLSWVMYLTPLGVFALMAKCTASFGLTALRSSGAYIAWAYGGCLLVLGAVMILPLWVLCQVTPGQYFARMGRLFMTSLATCSSAATLPETMRTCREEFHVSERVTAMVVPLGSTVHMCGGAVSFCLLGTFALQMTGRPITGGTLLLMLLLAEMLNMAAPGIPGGGIVLGATFLGMLGLEDMELFLGMYAGIYRLLDMAYTSLNVAGDVTANLLLERWEKEK